MYGTYVGRSRSDLKEKGRSADISVYLRLISKTSCFTFGGNKKLELDRPLPKKWSFSFEIKRFQVLTTVISMKRAVLSDCKA